MAGGFVALAVGFIVYRAARPFARKYADAAARRAVAAAAQRADAVAATTGRPIGHTTDGEPIYPIVGYTSSGQPVTADRAVGLQPAPITGTNGMSIAALITGLTVGPLAIIFGHLALSQIKRTGQNGRAFAIAGLILGYLGLASWTVLAAFLVALI